MAESWFMRGEGGSIIKMDLPFPWAIQQRFDAGLIVRVNEDGSPWSEPRPRPEPVDVDGDDADLGPVRPERAAPKARWVAFAELVSDLSHDEALAMTKAELVEQFGR